MCSFAELGLVSILPGNDRQDHQVRSTPVLRRCLQASLTGWRYLEEPLEITTATELKAYTAPEQQQ